MGDQDRTGTIRLLNLTRAEARDLERFVSSVKDIPEENFQFIEETLPEGRLGEPVTIIVVASLTAAAIGVLGAWLLKNRTKTSFRYHVVTEHPDGTKETADIKYTQQASEAPSKEILEQLASITKIPVKEIANYFSEG